MPDTPPHDLSLTPLPRVYQEFRDAWDHPETRRHAIKAYQQRQASFIPRLLPEQAVQLPTVDVLRILYGRFGDAVDIALRPDLTTPDHLPPDLPEPLRGPVFDRPDGAWLRHSNMVGVNIRTIGSFWNIIPYTLTLPAAQEAVHLLPIWEPGVVGSMYGMSSWQLNSEFFSADLAATCPWLNTIERQLRATVNLLHLMGRAVGMDVIPHTDRFSEMALANPEHFEWLQREDAMLVNYAADLYRRVQERIFEFLTIHGVAEPGHPLAATAAEFFHPAGEEADRLRLLFGRPEDQAGRRERRNLLIRHLHRYGYETAPATMAPPYRGLRPNPRPEARIVDANGLAWREYEISAPQPMSRVFGPLSRYQLYERRDNHSWDLDFSRPRHATWHYVCQHYADAQRRYGFDFMRGDMSHVQMRPDGVPAEPDRFYDILGAVKQYIRQEQGVRHFGYFAETFLAPRDVMGYGDEIEHLEASHADSTLGDLQSTVVGSPEFLQQFRRALDILATRRVAPNFTVMTADKDDPRFDRFYVAGNEARLFIALFLADMPSYMALGFETRDMHLEPAPNEHYTKLFVFQESAGPKATHGAYVWGKNGALYHTITRLKHTLDDIWPLLRGRATRWLIPPDATGASGLLAWTHHDAAPNFLFVVNTHLEHAAEGIALPAIDGIAELDIACSTAAVVPAADTRLTLAGWRYRIARLAPGEGRVYRRVSV